MYIRICFLTTLFACLLGESLCTADRQAPPGMFTDLDDKILGDAIVLNGKQLFIDDHLIESLDGVEKVLNQPTKYSGNPILTADQPWEQGREITFASVIWDQPESLFKLWYGTWLPANPPEPSEQTIGYATSEDGIVWEKPIVNKQQRSNIVITPQGTGFQAPGIMRDPVETDPQRRFKMLYAAAPDGTAKTWSTNAAYSPDGIRWTAEPQNPIIPFSDTQPCPYWDARRGRYSAILRWGPPNVRYITRIESEDFVHWSPKVRLFTFTKMDQPFDTVHYGMRIMQYEGAYIGVLTAYHGETIKPIPVEEEAWMNKVDAQLTYSRNGVTWMRVGKHGAIPPSELDKDRDWKKVVEEATFIPLGEHKKDWDWGAMYVSQPPLVVGDTIRFYYAGTAYRHWHMYHNDTDPRNGLGMATLRLDGFVSVETDQAGSLTTKPLVFFGDTLVVNANAKGGSLTLEALDAKGEIIKGFAAGDCTPITTDSVHHVVTWKGNPDCHLLQGRPIKLRFHLNNAKLYSFESRIQHKHYLQAYD